MTLTLAESVLELASQGAQVAHAAGTGGLAADGLGSPVVYKNKNSQQNRK